MLSLWRLEVDNFAFLVKFMFSLFLLVFYFFSIIVSRDVVRGVVGGGLNCFLFSSFCFFLVLNFCSRDVVTVVVGGGLDGRGGRGRTVPRQRHLTEAWLTPDDVGMFAKNGIDKNNKIAKQVEK